MLTLLSRDEVGHLLREAEVAHLGFEASKGPHVTPELFAWTGGRLWFATARRTLKARKIETGSRVGILLKRGQHSLAMIGEARPLDAVRPLSLLLSPHETALSPAGMTAFTLRNVRHLAGFIAQGPGACPKPLSTLRMFISVRPVAAALLRGNRLLEAEGPWQRGIKLIGGDIDSEPFDVTDVPDDLAAIADNFASDAVIAVSTGAGTAVLPATWDPEESVAHVARELLQLAGAREGEAAVEIERMDGYAMDGKRGVLLRGQMRVTQEGHMSRVEFDPDKATVWRGMRTKTVPT